MNSTEKAFSEKIKKLIPEEGRLIIAFSGGCDSLALLALCAETIKKDRIVPVYVNHRLRDTEELEKELVLNRENCRSLGLELVEKTLEKGSVEKLSIKRGGGLEDAARYLRYEVLEKERLIREASRILTAHHRQDQIETLIMRLSNGSPVTSLRGIAEKDENRHLVRPLLEFGRDELENYLQKRGFKWSTDTTNTDEHYYRNRVRNTLLPEMKAIWPDCENAISGLGKQAAALCDKVNIPSGTEIELNVFENLDPSSRVKLLFSMWDSLFGEKELPMSLVMRVLKAVEDGFTQTVGANGALFTVYHGKLYLTDPGQDEIFGSFEAEINTDAEQSIALPDGMVFKTGMVFEDLDVCQDIVLRLDPKKFASRARLRFARTGDRILLKSGEKTVARLLQNMGIPSVLRKRVPVITDDDGLCAVMGRVYGGRDRICVKFITSLARNHFPLYIVTKG